MFIGKFSLVSSNRRYLFENGDYDQFNSELMDSRSGRNFGNIFYVFVPGAQSNKDNKTLQVQA